MKLFNINLTFLLLQIALSNAINFDIGDLSKCTLSCLLQTFPAANCSLTDSRCQCHDQALVVSTSRCMLANCTLAESLALGKLRDKICNRPVESRQRPMFIIGVSTGVLSLIAVSLRFLSRHLICKRIWLEDRIILAAMIFDVTFTVIASWIEFKGLGKHIWDIPISNIPKIFKFYYIDESLYLMILILIKISILQFYLRIFPRRRFQIATKAMQLFVILSGVVILLLQILQCLPVAYNWDTSIKGAKCLNVNALTYTHAGFTIAQDLMILMLPIPELLSLQLETSQRVGVIFLFQVGAFACITSMVRLRFLTKFGGANSLDPTWDNVDATIWTAAEVNSAITCSCLPAIRALLNLISPGLLKSIGRTGSIFSSNWTKPRNSTVVSPDCESLPHNHTERSFPRGDGNVVAIPYLDEKPLPLTPLFNSPWRLTGP